MRECGCAVFIDDCVLGPNNDTKTGLLINDVSFIENGVIWSGLMLFTG